MLKGPKGAALRLAATLGILFLGTSYLAAWQRHVPAPQASLRRSLLEPGSSSELLAADGAGLEQHSSAMDGRQTIQASLREHFTECTGPGIEPGAPYISSSVPLVHVASNRSEGLGHVGGLSDPSVVSFKGHYIAAFTDAFVTKVHFAVSPDGKKWVTSSTALDGYSWTSLLVHEGQLYLIGPEGQLWFRKGLTNDLQLSRLEFEPPATLWEAGRIKLTQGLGVHVVNQAPLVEGDRVTFPFMVAPAASKLDPVSVARFMAANASLLDQGMHVLETSGTEVVVGILDWDASLFGVVVSQPYLGPNAFVRLEDSSTGATAFARIVSVEGPTLWVVPELWNTSCQSERQDWACKSTLTRASAAGEFRLVAASTRVWPDHPIFQEFLLGVLSFRGDEAGSGSLMDSAAWRVSRLVGNPAMRYPQAHKLWSGPSIQERSMDGTPRQCTGTGEQECIYWQEPVPFASREGRGKVNIAVRLTTDQNCNTAVLCTFNPVNSSGELECGRLASFPGFGNVRGHVFYDHVTRLYWALNNFNTDTTTEGSSKGFVRVGQRCFDERGNVGLFYSGDMHNFALAKVVAKATSHDLALSYSSCTTDGLDLICVSKTNGNLLGDSGCLFQPGGNHHSSRLIVSFQIANYRDLVH